MKRALAILVCLGCGGGTKPAPVANQAEPVEPRIEDEPASGAVVFQRTAR